MAIRIDPVMTTAMRFVSDRRLYLDANGTVVEADDPIRQTLLVAAGGTIPLAQAQALGLVSMPAADPDAMPAADPDAMPAADPDAMPAADPDAMPDPDAEKDKAKPPLNKAKAAPENKSA